MPKTKRGTIIECAVEGCVSMTGNKTTIYCNKHLNRFRRHGDPRKKIRASPGEFICCSVSGCEQKATRRGMCELHYDRLKRSGSTDAPKKITRLCSLDGCDRKHEGNGYCAKHNRRNKLYGDPNKVLLDRDAEHGRNSQFIIDVVNSKLTDECVIWPYGKTIDGYGMVKYKGQGQHAHALALRLYKCEPPVKGMHAAHNCGVKDCVNPLHIEWKTPKQNNDDKYAHGTILKGSQVWNSILTEKNVIEIRKRAKQGVSVKTLSEKYGVKTATIYSVVSGRNWSHSKDISPS